MFRFLQPLLLLLARLTDRQLAAVVQYLKVENQILRSKLPKRITVTAREKQRLVKFGRPLGAAIKDLITIVTPRTFLRWANGERPRRGATGNPRRPPGRPRTADDLRDLVLRIASETGWGYTRILGELKTLGLGRICRSTVVNILKEAGLDPGPKRGEHTWAEFLSIHAATLWQCDFFSHKVLTWRGWKDSFVLAFIHVSSRRVFVSPCTRKPDAAWVQQQAAAFVGHLTAIGQARTDTIVFRDRDGKYTSPFDVTLRAAGIDVRKTPVRSPNMAAFIERWGQSLRVECLDRMLALGETHLNHIVQCFVDHYNTERPHQSRGNRPLPEADQPDLPLLPFPERGVVCEQRLGGLLKHYRRAA
jgi:putative transposase